MDLAASETVGTTVAVGVSVSMAVDVKSLLLNMVVVVGGGCPNGARASGAAPGQDVGRSPRRRGGIGKSLGGCDGVRRLPGRRDHRRDCAAAAERRQSGAPEIAWTALQRREGA